MAAIINYATAYQTALQTRYSQNGLLYSQRLWNSPSNGLIKFTGAKTIKLPKLLILSGRKDRTRRTITGIDANYENQWEEYTLQNERYWSTLVDPSDIDETNYVTSIANITKTYNDVEKIPEMDKQMFSSLFARKQAIDGANSFTELALTAKNVLETFDDLMLKMDDAEVPTEGRVLYVTPTIKKVLKQAEGISRSLSVQNNNQTIDRRVSRLDEVEILPVPSGRFKTLYDFTDGAKDITGSQQIQMMLIHIPCMAAPQKYDFVALDEPSAKTSGNYLYYEQSYDDVLVFEQKSAGLEFVIEPAAEAGGGE
nr:MAG TPA: major capsid protein [Caudoviricetes sp.]